MDSDNELVESAWGDLVDPRERLNDEAEFYGTSSWSRPFTTIDDRADGKFLPIYQTQIDLARIRAGSRNLAMLDGVAIGAIGSLANYIFGKTGIQLRVNSVAAAEVPEGLVESVQARLDHFLDLNRFHGEVDREIHHRSREDGEAFVQLASTPQGVITEFFEPDQLREPAESHLLHDWLRDRHDIDLDAFVASWSFGVLSPKAHANRVLGYHVVHDSSGNDWDFLPAGHVEHFKRNVPQSAKRGVSDLYAVLEDMRNEAKLSRNMVLGAALQAAIAWIEEFPAGTTEAQVGSLTKLGAESTVERTRRDGGQKTINKTRLQPGTIVRTSPGRSYKTGPMGAERNQGFLTVAQYIMRRIGVRWTLPEALISGDASNANLASSLVAEAPFVHAREADQQWYGRRFISLLWKVLRIEFDSGYFDSFGLNWAQFEGLLDVVAEYPAVATRDKLQQAQVHETYVRIGLLSKATAATEAGYNLEEEIKKGAMSQEDAAAASQQTKDEREYDLARRSLELSGKPALADEGAVNEMPMAGAAGVVESVSRTPPEESFYEPTALASGLLTEAIETARTTPEALAILESLRRRAPPPPQMASLLAANLAALRFVKSEEEARALLEGFNPSQPRDDQGQWVDTGELRAAKSNPAKALALRNRVTNPKERAKLDVLLGIDPRKARLQPSAVRSGSPAVRRGLKPRTIAPLALSARAKRAKLSHNPSSKAKQDASEFYEVEVTAALGGLKSGDNLPMDVIVAGKHGVEVKVMHDVVEGRVNMRPDSRKRKEAWARRNKGTLHTLLIDARDKFEGGRHVAKYSGNRYYIAEGVGAFRLEGMTKMNSLSDVKAFILGGQR